MNEQPTPSGRGQFKRILFATDFSENASLAFDYAVHAAASHPGASLHLLHALPEPDAHFWKGYIYDDAEQVDPDAKAKADIDRRLAAEYLPRVPAGVDFHPVFRVGPAVAVILDYAREIGADLLVLGRQGTGAFASRLLFGNVATKVARAASCPVLIVPMPAPAREDP